jgi:hypothetical protein
MKSTLKLAKRKIPELSSGYFGSILNRRNVYPEERHV